MTMSACNDRNPYLTKAEFYCQSLLVGFCKYVSTDLFRLVSYNISLQHLAVGDSINLAFSRVAPTGRLVVATPHSD